MRLKHLLWKEEQKKKKVALKNLARVKRGQIKWVKEALSWEHEHPKRGVE